MPSLLVHTRPSPGCCPQVQGASELTVATHGSRDVFSATLVGTDPDRDIAVLRVRGNHGLRPLPIGASAGEGACLPRPQCALWLSAL